MQKLLSELRIDTTATGVVLSGPDSDEREMTAKIEVSYDTIDALIAALEEAKRDRGLAHE